mmetsp:Transcript_14633/g.22686  ORF Transcript_14633/g.22686 Transcript_14633/m.22686 type:complete len:165 (+) Transcript_14633:1239-1733(+)
MIVNTTPLTTEVFSISSNETANFNFDNRLQPYISEGVAKPFSKSKGLLEGLKTLAADPQVANTLLVPSSKTLPNYGIMSFGGQDNQIDSDSESAAMMSEDMNDLSISSPIKHFRDRSLSQKQVPSQFSRGDIRKQFSVKNSPSSEHGPEEEKEQVQSPPMLAAP